MPSNYTTIQGDTWDIISLKNYNDEHFVGELIEQNWQHRDVVFFSAGVKLTIPDITTEQLDSQNLPPWRRSSASA